MNAVAKTDETQTLPAPTSPLEMLARAIEKGASTETLAKLMDLQERHEKNQARRAFDAAVADAKAEIPVIAKNRVVDFTSQKGRTHYRHEDLAEIARTVDPILAKHGLSYRFRTSSLPNEPVSVTCILSHRDGYSEENSLTAGRDDSGNKNSIQAVGSAITYLQRYTLKGSLGLAAASDDDGRASSSAEEPPAAISEAQAANLIELMESISYDRQKFLTHFKIETVEALPADRYDIAVASIKKIIDRRQAAGAAA